MVTDPYVYKNSDVLKNKLHIKEKDKLAQAEADYTILRMKQLLVNQKECTCTTEKLCEINMQIFQDLYDWAGEFRSIDIEKGEAVLGGLSVEYTKAAKIKDELKNVLQDINQIKWITLPQERLAEEASKAMAVLWKVHPFREGNTRTTVTFFTLYMHNQGIELNEEIFTRNSEYLRNALVAYNAVFQDLGDLSKKEYLQTIVKDAISPLGKETIQEKIKEAKQQAEIYNSKIQNEKNEYIQNKDRER